MLCPCPSLSTAGGDPLKGALSEARDERHKGKAVCGACGAVGPVGYGPCPVRNRRCHAALAGEMWSADPPFYLPGPMLTAGAEPPPPPPRPRAPSPAARRWRWALQRRPLQCPRPGSPGGPARSPIREKGMRPLMGRRAPHSPNVCRRTARPHPWARPPPSAPPTPSPPHPPPPPPRKVAQQITVAERELTQKRMDMELLKTQVENLQVCPSLCIVVGTDVRVLCEHAAPQT